MGLLSRVCSAVGGAISSVGSAISSGISAVASGVRGVFSAGLEAVKQAGAAIVNVTRNVLGEKSRNWFGILFEGVKGAIKGGVEGFHEGGLWGAIKGACKGGWEAAKTEYLRQKSEEAEEEAYRQYQRRKAREEEHRQEPPIDISHDKELMALATAVNEFLPTLSTKFKMANTELVSNFSEYLRVDISMAFIADIAERLSEIDSIAEVSPGDRRLIALVSKLIMDQDMSEAELQEFDSMVKQRYKKSLLLMGSERLFGIWTGEERAMSRCIENNNKQLALLEVRIGALENYKKYGKTLDPNQTEQLEKMRHEHDTINGHQKNDSAYYKDLRIVTGASEGLLHQAECDDRGEAVRAAERARMDRAGAILENMVRDMETVRKTRKLVLSEPDRMTLTQFADLYMPGAIKRQKDNTNEYIVAEVTA
ncbi:hypothetical protein GEOBRER4_n2819 [Citrifermentans bremense]|uniref:Uncharacterized protein n=1 Tax=Citrifermentans bremense TaxID=60035 RepID=A0A6S6M8Y4_9BACT|nr:hypothetical protein [Citrifermentans bremense]BCG47961.1 hypothetical protein GEOBRER4_n2819 [Citrifermentans bremense]